MPVFPMITAVLFVVPGRSGGFHGFGFTEQAGFLGFVEDRRYGHIQRSVLGPVTVVTGDRSIGLFLLVAGFLPFSLTVNVSFAISSPIVSPT